jgi:hypothetical protein
MWYISFSGKQSDVPQGQSRGATSAYLTGNQLIYTFLDETNEKYSFIVNFNAYFSSMQHSVSQSAFYSSCFDVYSQYD